MALLDNLTTAVTALEAEVANVITEINTLKGNSADPAAVQALADRVTAAVAQLQTVAPAPAPAPAP